jgi:hypothetical protein
MLGAKGPHRILAVLASAALLTAQARGDTIITGAAYPLGLAVNASGDVFIADPGLDRVVEDTPASGGGWVHATVDTGSLTGFADVAVDAAGDLFIAEEGGVVKETPQPGGGYAQTSVLSAPCCNPSVAVDAAGDVFTTSVDGTEVVEETPQAGGGYTQTVVAGGVGPRLDVTSVAVDPAGDVFAIDGNIVVEEAPKAGGGYVQSVVTSQDYPVDLAVDASGDVFVADGNDGYGGWDEVVEEIPQAGGGWAQTTVDADLQCPSGVAVTASGRVLIADDCEDEVLEETPGPAAATSRRSSTAALTARARWRSALPGMC